MANITFNAKEKTALTNALQSMRKAEWHEVLPVVAGIIGKKSTTYEAAKTVATETFGFKASSSEARIITYALTLGDRTPNVVAAVKAESEAKTVAASWSAVIGFAIEAMEMGADIDTAMDKARERYAPKADVITAHNRVASLTAQLATAVSEMRKAYKDSGEKFENMDVLEETLAAWTSVAPAKRK